MIVVEVPSGKLIFSLVINIVLHNKNFLASVGRRSSVLKVKPTPPPTELTSLKRHRSAPRTSVSKRKVLMDDTMVLHGEYV